MAVREWKGADVVQREKLAHMATTPTISAAQARRAAAREAIVAAARALIGEAGFAEAQMSLIAVRAGVGVGSIYQHFPSRSDLFAEIYRIAATREFEKVQAAVAAAQGPATAQIAAAVATFCARALRGGRFAYALLVEHSEPGVDQHRLAFREGYRSLFAELLERAVAQHEIAPQNTDISAAALLGIMTETLVRPLGEATPTKDPAALTHQVVTLCMATIEGPSSPAAATQSS
jgi:AcrR family transcriptional regulator